MPFEYTKWLEQIFSRDERKEMKWKWWEEFLLPRLIFLATILILIFSSSINQINFWHKTTLFRPETVISIMLFGIT